EPHVGSNTGHVARIGALRNDTFPSPGSCARQHGFAIAPGRRETYVPRYRIERTSALVRRQSIEQSIEMFAAVRPWRPYEARAVIAEYVERDEGRRHVLRRGRDVGGAFEMHAALQSLEPRGLAIHQGNDLAIEREWLFTPHAQLRERSRNLGKLASLVIAVAGNEANATGSDVREHANAVVLGLESPVPPGGDVMAHTGVHGLRARSGVAGCRAHGSAAAIREDCSAMTHTSDSGARRKCRRIWRRHFPAARGSPAKAAGNPGCCRQSIPERLWRGIRAPPFRSERRRTAGSCRPCPSCRQQDPP